MPKIEQLFDDLVKRCEDYGFLTEATFEHLRDAVNSLVPDEEEQETK